MGEILGEIKGNVKANLTPLSSLHIRRDQEE
jgi:hypothetical protein